MKNIIKKNFVVFNTLYIHFRYINYSVSTRVLSFRYAQRFYLTLLRRIARGAVAQRPLTTRSLVPSWGTMYGNCDGKCGTEPGSPQLLQCFPIIIIPPAFHTYSFICSRHYIISAAKRIFECNT